LHQNAWPNCSRDDGLERHCVLTELAVAGLAQIYGMQEAPHNLTVTGFVR
jgi:hypothetical protein